MCLFRSYLNRLGALLTEEDKVHSQPGGGTVDLTSDIWCLTMGEPSILFLPLVKILCLPVQIRFHPFHPEILIYTTNQVSCYRLVKI